MSEPLSAHVLAFGEARARFLEANPVDEIGDQAVFGIGMLIGAGAPQAAAALSLVTEGAIDERTVWPWSAR